MIKKIFFVLIIIVSAAKQAKAQTNIYQPFPKDSAIWFYLTSTPSGETGSWTKWLGDTTINSKTYTKIYERSNLANWGYGGGVRQDIPNQKMYSVNLSGVETDISVSQHLVIGDTMPLSYSHMLITNIDSTLIGTKYHKTYNSTDSVTGIQESYIVGVGLYSSSDGDANTMTNLVCFSMDTVNNPFGTSPPFCQLTYSIKQISNLNTNISIYPNPSTGIFNLSISQFDNNKTNSIEVRNLIGECVYRQIATSSNCQINLTDLDAGVYFISLTNGAATCTKKVVVSK